MTVRLAVAGLGWLGESLIKDVPRAGDFTVVAVQDVLPARASDIAARYGVGYSTAAFEDLLTLDSVDAVAVCTPNALHAAQAQMTLRAGKHALVQKPLALSYDDALATMTTARAVGRSLFVDYTYRFLDTMSALRDALPTLGRLRSVRAEFHNIYGPGAEKAWFFDRALSGGGALTDLGVHLLDLALWLLGPSVAELESVALRGDGPVETAADVDVRLDAVSYELSVSWNAPLPNTRIAFEASGEHGTVRWTNVDGSFFRFATDVDGNRVLERETTLREDTLRAFAHALETGRVPTIDARVYSLLDQAYARTPSSMR
jgi:predicted dehydrogenase